MLTFQVVFSLSISLFVHQISAKIDHPNCFTAGQNFITSATVPFDVYIQITECVESTASNLPCLVSHEMSLQLLDFRLDLSCNFFRCTTGDKEFPLGKRVGSGTFPNHFFKLNVARNEITASKLGEPVVLHQSSGAVVADPVAIEVLSSTPNEFLIVSAEGESLSCASKEEIARMGATTTTATTTTQEPTTTTTPAPTTTTPAPTPAPTPAKTYPQNPSTTTWPSTPMTPLQTKFTKNLSQLLHDLENPTMTSQLSSANAMTWTCLGSLFLWLTSLMLPVMIQLSA